MWNVRFVTLVGIVVAATAMRLVPHPPNVTPIAAIALFGGAHFASKRAALAVPLLAMCLSDLLLGFGVHRVMPRRRSLRHIASSGTRSEEHTSELQSRSDLVC